MKPACHIANLSFRFHEKAPLFFENSSFSLYPGALHFLHGKNGSGKSTLFRILQGATNESERVTVTISFNTIHQVVNQHQLPALFTNHVKTVRQNINQMLAPGFTAYQNLQLAALSPYPFLSAIPNARIIATIMDQFSIDYGKQIDLLSGGQRQMLAILMALQKPTTILLLDEPTAALDPKNAHLIMQSLHDLAAQTQLIVVIICHDQELVEQYGTGKTIFLYEEKSGVRTIHQEKQTSQTVLKHA